MKLRNVLCGLLVLLMVISLTGCGKNSGGDSVSNSGEPFNEPSTSGSADTIIVAYASGPSVLDPVMIPGDNATIWLTDLLFGTLPANQTSHMLQPQTDPRHPPRCVSLSRRTGRGVCCLEHPGDQ